jgi:hypothetical protein
MNGLSDSLTIGILLILIFGAVAFYLYSRLSQNEKRMGLLENLLLSLKMNTEASLGGPDSIEAISGAEPISSSDVEDVDEEEYADMLKEIPSGNTTSSTPTATSVAEENQDNQEEEEELLRAAASVESEVPRTIDLNYESMSVKELSSLAKQRGLSAIPQRKKEIIDMLKKSGVAAPIAPTPLPQIDEELEGVDSGFEVNLQDN